jgi:Acetyltransferase (GNAT) family
MSSVNMQPSAMIARANAAYVEFFRTFARTVPGAAIIEREGIVMVGTGRLLPFFNLAALTRVPNDPVAMIERAEAFFAPYGNRFMLVEFEPADALASVMEARGAQPGAWRMMLLSPITGSPPIVPELAIRTANDPEALYEYNDAMTTSFGGDPWATRKILGHPDFLAVRDASHYTGFVDGRLVATAMRFTTNRMAVIANVSTIPEFRKRGIGEAMTWRATLDGLDEGCIAAYLQASNMGFPIYARMGFRHVVTHLTWLSPAKLS